MRTSPTANTQAAVAQSPAPTALPAFQPTLHSAARSAGSGPTSAARLFSGRAARPRRPGFSMSVFNTPVQTGESAAAPLSALAPASLVFPVRDHSSSH